MDDTTSQSHPELDSELDPLATTFSIDVLNAHKAIAEINEQTTKLSAAITSFIDRAYIGGVDMLKPILQFNRERPTLEKLGKALLAVAPLVERYDKLKSQAAVLEAFAENPQLYRALLGNFDGDIDSIEAYVTKNGPTCE